MKPIIIKSNIVKLLGFRGITLYPFIIIADDQILKHEMIHVEQIQKHGVVKFYTLYLYYFAKNLIKFKDWNKAYREIPFEKEAYERT